MDNKYCGCKFCEKDIRKTKRRRIIIIALAVIGMIFAFGLVGRMERNIELMPDDNNFSTGEYDYKPL